MSLSSSLLEMIERVACAPDQSTAAMQLLLPLLKVFEMDQAALCELKGANVVPVFAVDHTRKILTRTNEVWLSRTLVQQAIESQQPTVHREDLAYENSVPRSVSENRIKCVVCVPLGRESGQVIYLVSQRNPLRHFSETELAQFRTAAQASWLALRQHQSLQELKSKNAELEKLSRAGGPGLVYVSSAMSGLLSEIERIARFNVSILIQGESGVGKEELAKEIHRQSGRSGPFIAVNCANLSESLLESELFGYVKGAFTGATNSKKGLMAEADGGTFFLDEIAELPLNLQAKLLRALQERVVRPVGGVQDSPVDIRIVTASHVNLHEAISQKRFREDLYYRIQEMTIVVPPLRERGEDVELLAHHFVSQVCREFQFPTRALSKEALARLLTHSWPGNARELKNVCRTAVLLSRGDEIQAEDIRLVPRTSQPIAVPQLDQDLFEGSLKERSRKFEQMIVKRMLGEPGQNQSAVALRLGISVRTLQRILSDDDPNEPESLARI